VKDINTFIFISAFAMGAMIVNSLGIWTLYKNREWAEKLKTIVCVLLREYLSLPR